jgi:zinc transporter 1
MLTFTFTYSIVELVIGNITHSVALRADAFHMLSDVLALLIALVAVRISKRRSDINTYGWVRAEVVGANINTVFLLALSLTIVFDAIQRYISPEAINNPTLLLIVGSIGLGINIIGLFLFQGFHGHSHGGGTHDHSHHEDNTSKTKIKRSTDDGKADKESIVVDRHENPQMNHTTTTSNGNDDIEVFESMPGQSEFKRHSLRALEEVSYRQNYLGEKFFFNFQVIVDCPTDSHGHSHGDSHGHSHGYSHGHSHGHSHDSSPPVVCSTSKAAPSTSNKPDKKAKAPSMNMHGIFLHVLADALGSIGVIISALLIKFVPHDPNDLKNWTVYIDPTLSVFIVIIITISALPLFKETSFVLLQTIPKHIKVDELKKQLLEDVPEVEGIHELHVWRLTGEKIIASAHLERRSLVDYMSVANKVKHFFHLMGIHSTTIQYEYDGEDIQTPPSNNNTNAHTEPKLIGDCLLRCTTDACDTLTCCVNKPVPSDKVLNSNNSSNDVQRPTTGSGETSKELNDEHHHEHDCGSDHHSHTHVSIPPSAQDNKL